MTKIQLKDLKNNHIILLATYKSAGENGIADAEDIAVNADKLVKGKFRWKKYKKYIDLYMIKNLLANARDQENLIKGGANGWGPTEAGVKLVQSIKDQITYSGQRLDRLSKFDKGKIDFEMDRILNCDAYKNFKLNNQPSVQEIRKLFRINEYTSADTRKLAPTSMIRLFKNNDEIKNFLKIMRERLLNE